MKDRDDERDQGPYKAILRWFADGNKLVLTDRATTKEHEAALAGVPSLIELTDKLLKPQANERALWQEFLVEGLFHGGVIARDETGRGLVYSDLLAHMMGRQDKKKRKELG